jgi:hypothetical protein
MKIADIIPYARNARHNEKAVPAVANSIREFGLRGTIGLESRENPVIVFGHTRVAACKSLGWEEIPDERIEYCDDLTDEQIRAFRIADNKTGDIATYNKAMLREEVRGIKSLDMSRFACDFKSKALPYGAERMKTDRAYNLDLVNIDDCGADGMPTLAPCDAAPETLLPFNYVKSTEERACGVHFFIDDYQFERLWNRPRDYMDLLSGFECVLTPDFSLYLDMPLPMMRWNVYRARALGHLWQRYGMQVVPTLTWARPDSYEFCFGGLPQGATVATSTVGVHGDEEAERIWREGMQAALEAVKPKRLLLYGGRLDGFEFGGAEVIDYPANAGFRGK